jgi:hypothetical protein
MNAVALWLNTIGLALGVTGAFGLAMLTKTFIVINPDGSQRWGRPPEMQNDVWLKRNIKIRRMQTWGIPLSYGGIGLGFVLQLVALWSPKLANC